MPFFFVLLMTPIGVAIALYRRNPRRFLDGPSEDPPLRLLRWAVSLLSPQRAEWGQAMLGELGHLDGRLRRMLRARLYRCRPDPAALGPARRRPLGDDRDHRSQLDHLRRPDRPLPARRR
jgi:hypothetical protein